ncbi:hypothetical protein BGZ95_007232 [Linnemannia exigua]|uniref:Uncharacterized protein n=1 Tax=Linnemannia exigua TaxID=604196 RepID=A0AAD4DN84_9FUNG|nr:hypothetical protein BGZ95_007232 [Linnemannia exigua]
MRAITIITVLAGAALTTPALAAPVTLPSNNDTLTGDLEYPLTSRVVKVNRAEEQAFASKVNVALYSNSTLHRINGPLQSRSMISPSVSVTSGSRPVSKFSEEMSCDISGWANLYNVATHSKENFYTAKPDESRSMFFTNKASYNGGKGASDFAFYKSEGVRGGMSTKMF